MTARSGAWTSVVKDAVEVDRSSLSLVPAVRCALGMAIPLVAGDLSGHLLTGVAAAIGAVTTGMASLQGAYRSGVKVMALAASAFAVSAFVGATIGHLEGPDIVITAIWGLGAGMLVMFGQAPSVIGLQAVIGLVVFSQFAFSAPEAAFDALWALCGGALQIVLVAATWPLQRFPEERRASSAAYRELASHVLSFAGDSSALLDPTILDDLRSALRETQPLGDHAAAAAYQALADEAERIGLEAAGIARVRSRLAGASAADTATAQPRAPDAAREVDSAIVASAHMLSEAANALHDGRSLVADPEDREQFRSAIENLRSIVDSGERPDRAVVAQAVAGLTALGGQLRAVAHLTAVAAGMQRSEPAPSAIGARPRRRWRPSPLTGTSGGHAESVRANLTLESEAFRHALRVGVTLAVAVTISHLFPFGHGYWLPMTVMIVLKPDFAATSSRGLARSVGTLLGAGLVTLFLVGVKPSPAGLIALTVALYAICIAVLRANYAIYSLCIASLVVSLLAFTGTLALSLAADRAFYTVLGAVLALVAYVVWPTWERARVPDRLADLVEVDGQYGAALLHAWADPAAADRAALQQLRLAARLARSNAEASVDRWLSEPTGRGPAGRGPEPPSWVSAETARGILAEIRRYVWGALALHGQLPTAGPARPDLHRLGVEVRHALAGVAMALRTGSLPSSYPALRTTQVALAARLMVDSPARTADPALARADMLVVGETDLMVNAVDTLAHLVGIEPQTLAGS